MDHLLGKAPRGAALAAAILAAAAASAIANASTQQAGAYVIRGDASIAGFSTTGRLAEARRVFGSPATLRRSGDRLRSCLARWPAIGLTVTFRGRGCQGSSAFVRALITGRDWATLRGLAVGQSLAVLRRKYPDSRRRDDTWTLLSRRGVPTLSARVEGGRIRSLTVSAFQTTIRW